MYARHGGFLDDIDLFDASFFGISPREAQIIDPQQRLLLEVGWEALENAGHGPDRLSESLTGIFLAINNSDYFRHVLSAPDHIDAYATVGNASSIAASRPGLLTRLTDSCLAVCIPFLLFVGVSEETSQQIRPQASELCLPI